MGKFRYCILPLLGAAYAAGAQEDFREISTSNDRALGYMAADIASQMAAGTIITFEEMPFEYADDLQLYRDDGYPRILPLFGDFSFSYSPSSSVQEILSDLLEKYHSEYPGNYKFIGEGSIFHIVPDASKDVNGNYVRRESILDEPLTIRLSNATAMEALCEVIKELSLRKQADIGCSVEFMETRLEQVVISEYSLENASARDHFVEIRWLSGLRLSWKIYRTQAGKYAVNFFIQP